MNNWLTFASLVISILKVRPKHEQYNPLAISKILPWNLNLFCWPEPATELGCTTLHNQQPL